MFSRADCCQTRAVLVVIPLLHVPGVGGNTVLLDIAGVPFYARRFTLPIK
jgi:hypothetical protein